MGCKKQKKTLKLQVQPGAHVVYHLNSKAAQLIRKYEMRTVMNLSSFVNRSIFNEL